MSNHKQILKAHKVRLYPNEEQKVYFAKSFGCCRFIWNRMLSDKIKYYEKTKKTLRQYPAQYKKEFEWLKEVDSLALSRVERNLHQAYQSFFKQGTGFPKFKKKGVRDSYTTNNQKGTVAVTGNSVKLPKIGHIKAVVDRPIVGLIKSATISKTATDKYYASLLVETVVEPLQKPTLTSALI